MSTPNLLLGPVQTIFQAFRSQVWLWMTPTLAMTVVAVGYALVRPTTWGASQAIVVRDEAIGNFNPQGRFNSTETMKAFQETILEVARSHAAVESALKSLSPPKDRRSSDPWPSADEVQAIREQINVSAPKGAEFGSTEVIYLSVQGQTREEAIARTQAICDQLEERLSALRNAKAEGVIAELAETLNLALNELELATTRLEAIEREVGGDLAELRFLNDSGAGVSNLRTALNEIKAEVRQVSSTFEANRQLHDLLTAAREDPDQLLAMPSALLTSQPSLARLRSGLVDAQLRTADLRGSMSDDHPLVLSAVRAEDEVRQNIVAELSGGVRGIQSDLQVSEQQLGSLRRQQDELQQRLDRLASLRARYGTLVDDVRQRTEIVNHAKQDVADAKASQSAAKSISLLTRFQLPETSNRPLGPGRSMIVAAGVLGGLMIGAGLVFLTLPNGQQRGRRWSDLLHFGRRNSDHGGSPAAPAAPALSGGRRTSDPPPTTRRESESRAGERRSTTRRGDDR